MNDRATGRPRDSRGTIAGVIVGVLAIVAAIVIAYGLLPDLPGPPGTAAVLFTSPADGTAESSSFTVTGTATGLGSGSAWLFVIGGNNGVNGNVRYRVDNAPLAVGANGEWSTRAPSLGEANDPSGQTYTLGVIYGDTGCTQAIASLQPDKHGEVILQGPIPDGCSRTIPTLQVKKG